MPTAQDRECLELLRALPPLLSPDLPSLPPSALATDAATLKRKREARNDAAKPTVGYGLGVTIADEHDTVGNSAKRHRPSAPPPPPPASAPSSRGPPPPPPPAPPAAPSSTTPDLRNSPAISAAKGLPAKGSPSLGPASISRTDREAEWRKEWPKARLRQLAAQCRDHGRKLKHTGDAVGRASSSDRKDVLRALAYHVDSILLYVFSFWCDDVASRTCNVQQWASMFGLIAFVRKMAEREDVSVVVGLCARMEAIAVYTTSMHEQKALNFAGTQLIKAPASSVSSSRPPPPPPPPSGPPPPPAPPAPAPPPADAAEASPLSTTTASPAAVASPAPASAASPPNSTALKNPNPKAYDDFLKSFLRASPDLFRHQRLYDDSCLLLSPAVLAASFPKTWTLCTHPTLQTSLTSFVVPSRPWRFAWPAELGRGTLGHQVAWARAILEEWSEQEQLGYTPEDVGEGV